MKKIIWLFAVLLIVSCKNEVKEYVTLKGKLKTPNLEKLTVQGNGFSKEIKIASDGAFSDTLKVVKGGTLALMSGNDRITLFLKNGYDLNMEFKGENFADGIVYQGNGAETNNFLQNKSSFYRSDLANPTTYFNLDKEAYDAKVAEAKSVLKNYKDKAQNLDSLVENMDTRNDEMFFGYLDSNYEKMHLISKGKASPIFTNYENNNGGKTSLTDFKGKYVFIDIWATWCAPCKAEIPYLKALEEEFKGKNIEFISISVDNLDAHDAWKKMVKDQDLGGTQLFADNNTESGFMTEYGVNTIPRFILLDPQGNIIDSDAEKPSNPKLKELFKEVGI